MVEGLFDVMRVASWIQRGLSRNAATARRRAAGVRLDTRNNVSAASTAWAGDAKARCGRLRGFFCKAGLLAAAIFIPSGGIRS